MTVMGTSTRRAIGIVRVSQRDDDSGHSPEVQARALLKQAADEQLTLAVADIWDENIDANGNVHPASAGAALADRPKLRAAVEAIERGEATAILAERFDRLFRNLDVQREVIRRVEAKAGRLITTSGNISHATADAELHANLNGSIAQYTKRTAMERSHAAVQIAISQGIVPWPNIPPGYARVKDKPLVPNADAATVVEAFRIRAAGEPIEAVRAFLAENGIERSYRGAQSMLRDRLYLGEIHFGAYEPNLAAHPAIVDRDLFNRVQRVKVPRGRRAKSDRLLARLGVLRCGSCGARMVVGTSNNSGYYLYRCPPTGDCKRRVTIAAEIVEKIVISDVRRALADVEGRASAQQNAREAEVALERAQAELDAAFRAFEGFDAEAARVRLLELTAVRDAAQERVDHLGSPTSALVISADADWDRLSLDARRALIRATVEQITVAPAADGPDRVTVELVGE